MSNARSQVVGVFGGAFDPPHLGHVLLPGLLRAQGAVDTLIAAPCADHPLGKQMRPFEQRLAWTRVAMRSQAPFVQVSAIERELAETQAGPSFSLRLLEAVAARHPGAQVRLVLGSDIVALGEVRKWHRWDEIERRFNPLVVPRAGYAEADSCCLPAISSTKVREAVASGAWGQVRQWVPAEVAQLLRAAEAGAPLRVLQIGAQGNVASHATTWLRERGCDVQVVSARALLDGDPLCALDASFVPDLVWCVVRDAALSAVGCALAQALPQMGSHPPVVHASGPLRAREVFAPLVARGLAVGSLHPICAMRRELTWPSPLGDACFGIEGDGPKSSSVLHTIKTLLALGPSPQGWLDLSGLSGRERLAYHAACALAANHLSVLQDGAAQVLEAQGHAPRLVGQALGALLNSALTNLQALGIPAGITGPVARGELGVVRAHTEALEQIPGSSAAPLYRSLSAQLQAIVARAASNDPG